MSEWQPIETAPRDGRIVIAYWDDMPVFVSWCDKPPRRVAHHTGRWPFRKTTYEEVEQSGFRVCIPMRGGGYGLHGNYAPFMPTHWMPLPNPPVKP